MRQEVFVLGLHLHWGYAEVMSMPVDERRDYVARLVETLERQSEMVRHAGRGSA